MNEEIEIMIWRLPVYLPAFPYLSTAHRYSVNVTGILPIISLAPLVSTQIFSRVTLTLQRKAKEGDALRKTCTRARARFSSNMNQSNPNGGGRKFPRRCSPRNA